MPFSYEVGKLHDFADGRGISVVARKSFGKGDLIMEYSGRRLGNAEHEALLASNSQTGSYVLQCENPEADDGQYKMFIDGYMRGNLAAFINHSCDPNTVYEFVSCLCCLCFMKMIICSH
jgi:SET domain-containing protein